jgi:hypothetical protein
MEEKPKSGDGEIGWLRRREVLDRCKHVRLAYQPPANTTFLSQQTSHQQSASSTFLSE